MGVRANSQTFTSIRSYFAWDHRRLEELLAAIARHLDEGHPELASRQFAHYERGMRRHMRLEEEILLEIYAHDRTGAARSPATRMLPEHAQIIKFMTEIGAALAGGDVPTVRARHAELVALVERHETQEEDELYPFYDSLVGPAEAERIVDRLRHEHHAHD